MEVVPTPTGTQSFATRLVHSWPGRTLLVTLAEPPKLCNCQTNRDPTLQWFFPSSFLLAVSESSLNSHIYAISALQPTYMIYHTSSKRGQRQRAVWITGSNMPSALKV